MTVGQIIRKALLLIGAVDRISEPTANEYSDGIITLNLLLKRLGVFSLGVHTNATVTHTLVSGTGIYTIGPTGDIVTTRPHKVIFCTVTRNGQEYPVAEMARKNYLAEEDKDEPGLVEYFRYEPTATDGTIYLYPYPDAADTLFLTLQQPLTEYAATSETVSLPDEYLAHLPYGVAVDFASEFGMQVPQIVAGRAEETEQALKRLHSTPVTMVSSNPIGRGTKFNIYRGD